jgi:hypothetical protein
MVKWCEDLLLVILVIEQRLVAPAPDVMAQSDHAFHFSAERAPVTVSLVSLLQLGSSAAVNQLSSSLLFVCWRVTLLTVTHVALRLLH